VPYNLNPQRNPYAPGGMLYDSYRQGGAGYDYGGVYEMPMVHGGPRSPNNPNGNTYAPGGINYGYQPGMAPNWTSQQLAQSSINQGLPVGPPGYPAGGGGAGGAAGAGAGSGGLSGLGDMLSKLAGQGGGGGGINYSSGITAGPVWGPGQVAQAQQGIGTAGQASASQPLAVPNAPAGMQSELQRQLQDATRAGTSQAQTQFGRDAAYKNAQQQLASEQARAQSGIQGANLGLQMQQLNQQPLLQLMKLFGGMIGGIT